MTSETILANARLVLPDEVVRGSVVLRDGLIADIATGGSVPAQAHDCDQQFLAPGLIELHTDNLERHMHPRPGVDWPHSAAILAHDRELAGTGITTVFDAIRVGSISTEGIKQRKRRYARGMADEILAMRNAGALKISHHLHLRAEICSETLEEELAEFGVDDQVGILSLMDHTPGQRQFTDLAKYEEFVCTRNNLSRKGFKEYVAFLYDLKAKNGTRHEKAAVAAARRYGATLASHDDTTEAHVFRSAEIGVTIAEFPTSLMAANACRQAGIATMLGAPNLVRGASHSGNVAAGDLAELDQLDILSSDYVPAALLLAAVRLGEIWGDFAKGMSTVTANPASQVGLSDRGSLRIGARGDLVQFAIRQTTPAVTSVWSIGGRIS